MDGTRLHLAAAGLMALLMLCSCGPIPNSVHTVKELSSNTLFTPFSGRSPKHLDPTSSYSSDETPFTYSIYEPLFQYHYLKRPYELIPRSAASVPEPLYLDKNGKSYLRMLLQRKLRLVFTRSLLKKGFCSHLILRLQKMKKATM